MKRYLLLMIAAFSLLVSAPNALAVKIRVVDAPPVVCAEGQSCDILDVTKTYAFTFMPAANQACQSAAATPNPGADIAGFTWCIVFNNLSSQPLTTLNFSFVVPEQGTEDSYDTVSCDGFPDSVENSSCPTAPLQEGQKISALFSADPGVANATSAYLFVDFANKPYDLTATFAPRVNATSVPEPGELGLFGLGLLAIGIGYGWQQRRQAAQGHRAHDAL